MSNNDPLSQINFDNLTPEQRAELLERVRQASDSSDTTNEEPKLTEILCVLDRSGSMRSMADEAIGGFNHFLDEQKKLPGKTQLTLVLFDHEYLVQHKALPLEEVPSLDHKTFVPRGMTALHDAIGRAIDDTLVRHARLDKAERPDQVVMCILTDGIENASKDYIGTRIFDMITARRAAGWEFVFLAADHDVVTTASRMGIPVSDAMVFQATPHGTQRAYRNMSAMVSEKRRRGPHY